MSNRMSIGDRFVTHGVLVAVTALFALGLFGCHTPTKNSAVNARQNLSPATLASIDAGHTVAATDPAVTQYNTGLDTIFGYEQRSTAAKKMTKEKILEWTVKVHDEEKRHGIQESCLSIMDAIQQMCAAGLPERTGVVDMYFAYTMVRSDKRHITTREEAIAKTPELARHLHDAFSSGG